MDHPKKTPMSTIGENQKTPLATSEVINKSPISKSIHPMIRRLTISGECEQPIVVNFEDISAAAFRIKNGIRRTPCEVDNSYLNIYKHNICRDVLLPEVKCYEKRLVF